MWGTYTSLVLTSPDFSRSSVGGSYALAKGGAAAVAVEGYSRRPGNFLTSAIDILRHHLATVKIAGLEAV